MTNYPDERSDDEWQKILSPPEFEVMRRKATEAPFVGKLDGHMPSKGIYVSFILQFTGTPSAF